MNNIQMFSGLRSPSKIRGILFLATFLLSAAVSYHGFGSPVFAAVLQEDGKSVEPADLEVGDRIRFKSFSGAYEGIITEIKSGGSFIVVQYMDGNGEKGQRTFISRSLEELTRLDPIRTWKSKSGKFKVKATLVELDEDKVVLKKEDGKNVTVPIEKLSVGDQKFLERHQAKLARKNAKDAWFAKPDSSQYSEIEIDPSNSISAASSGPPLQLTAQKVSVPNRSEEPIEVGDINLSPRLSLSQLPSIIFDRSMNHALLADSQRGAFNDSVNLIIVDLINGKHIGQIGIKQSDCMPVDISPSGKRLITRQIKVFDHRLDVWEILPDKLVHMVGWSAKYDSKGKKESKPQQGDDFASKMIKSMEGRDESKPFSLDEFKSRVEEATGTPNMGEEFLRNNRIRGDIKFELTRFIDDEHVVTTGDGGRVFVWKLNPLKVVRQIDTRASISPIAEPYAFSPDRKTLYALGDGRIRAFDLLSGKMTGITDAQQELSNDAQLSISPDGSRFLLDTRRYVQIVGSNGEILDEFAKSYQSIERPHWLDNRFYAVSSLTGTTIAFDTKYRVPVWKYQVGRASPVFDAGGYLWFTVGRLGSASNLLHYRIPHAAATTNLPADPDSLLVLKSGDRVRITFSGSVVPRAEIKKILKGKMDARGVEVDDNAEMELNIEGVTKTENTTYETVGGLDKRKETVRTKSTVFTLSLVKNGITLYSDVVSDGGAPLMVSVQEGQSIQSALPKSANASQSQIADAFVFPRNIAVHPNPKGVETTTFGR